MCAGEILFPAKAIGASLSVRIAHTGNQFAHAGRKTFRMLLTISLLALTALGFGLIYASINWFEKI